MHLYSHCRANCMNKGSEWGSECCVTFMPNCTSVFQLWTQRSDPVLHIELRRWADLLLIAPLDANTLGKIASGICDNLLVGKWAVLRRALCVLAAAAAASADLTREDQRRRSSTFVCFQTCVVRAWDCGRPLLFCPAMNTAMWQHPITAQQIARLVEFGYVEVPCISKKLVCGDEGRLPSKAKLVSWSRPLV